MDWFLYDRDPHHIRVKQWIFSELSFFNVSLILINSGFKNLFPLASNLFNTIHKNSKRMKILVNIEILSVTLVYQWFILNEMYQ